MATIKMNIREGVLKEWHEEWTNSDKANHTKGFYAGPNPGKARFVYKLARLELGRFVRIVTGHNNLGFFQTKLGLWGDPKCRFCQNGDETITHFMRACPRFISFQKDIFLDKLPTPEMTWSVRSLLDFSYTPGINDAYEGDWREGGEYVGEAGIMDETLGASWLEEEGEDENNNPY